MQAPEQVTTTRLGNRRLAGSRCATVFATSFCVLATTVALTAPARAAAPKNPVGYCTMDVEKAKKAGFDYIEVQVKSYTSMTDEDFGKFLAKTKELGVPTPVANNFIPGELKVVGPAVELDKVLAYVNKAFDRSKQLGVKTIVFGSGGARKVPDGFAKDEAMKQLVTFAKKIAPEAQKRGIVVAVEPLQTKETNIINTAGEGLEWVKAVGHPNFALMVDFYHLALEKEDPAILVKAQKQIKHIHIANPKGRLFPLSSEEYDYSGFFDNLRKSKYKGAISVEGKALDYDKDAPTAIAFLRDAAAKGVSAPLYPAASEAGSAGAAAKESAAAASHKAPAPAAAPAAK